MKRIATVAAITAVVVLGGGTGVWASGSISGDNIKANTIDGSEIQNNSIASADLKDGSIASADIKDGTVSGADVADASLTGSDIKDGSLGSNDLVSGAVGSVQIKDGSITAADIRQDTLTYIEAQANANRGGKTGIVGYSEAANAQIPVTVFGDAAEAGDFLLVVTATFTEDKPVRVALDGAPEIQCIAVPAGFDKSACSFTAPISIRNLLLNVMTADGSQVNDGRVQTMIVKVG
jgi:hypothetical protein